MKSFAFTEDIILFGNRKKGLWTSKAAGLTVVLEEWVAEKKRNTGGQVADNGDETPSKLCSSQQSSECFTSIT